MSLLEIRVLGDPVLRQETEPVTEITDALRTLIADMMETMHEAQGIGLAAPQVGRTERVAVVDVDGAKYVLINPEILSADGTARAEEGCLSIPEVYGDVDRPTTVRVRAMNESGELYELEASELLARCIQHEIDHLHGRLFIDYFSLLKRKRAMAKWSKEKVKYPNFVRRLTPGEVAEHHHRDEEL